MESIFALANRKGVSMCLLTPRYESAIRYCIHCAALDTGGYPATFSDNTVDGVESQFREWLEKRKDYPVLVPGEVQVGKYSGLTTKIIAKEADNGNT